MTTWTLTGKPSGTGQCEHCDRELVHRYEVTSDTGSAMIVGRGCLKTVTGWTLTAAQAEREVRMIAIRADRAARWAEFAAARPETAAAILADCATWAAKIPAHLGGGVPHEVKLYVETGRADMAADYLARRQSFAWARSAA